jgi:hypothetical protein
MAPKDTGSNAERKGGPQLLKELVPMPMAATLAYIRTTGTKGKVSERQMDAMAGELARLITLYSISDSPKSIVALGPDDTQGGRFKNAGKVVEFSDGRKITGLAVTRTSLNAAIDALTREKALKQGNKGA